MSIKITIPNSSSDVLTFGSGNTPTAAQIAGIDSGSSNGQLALYTTASGTSTERVRVDASGNVGIGTSSPSAKLNVYDGTSSSILASTPASDVQIAASSSGYGVVGTVGNYALVMRTNATERARIDSSGNLLVGTTNANFSISSQTMAGAGFSNSGYLTIGRTDYCVALQRNGTNGVIQYFFRGNNEVGSISVTTTATTYTTTSDYRLKEAVQPMTGALARVQALKPVTYKWKADGSDGEGFIAHELQAVVPECVVGEKDAVDAEGNPVYQGIDTSFLVATLTAAIQEQQAIIQTLTDRITALENK